MTKREPTYTAEEIRAELARVEAFCQIRGWDDQAVGRYQRLQRELASLEEDDQ